MKTTTAILFIIILTYGCDNAYPKESEPTKTYLWNLRKDASNAISDSILNCMSLSLTKYIEGKRDSALYYRGKVDAYYNCEKLVWPTYPTDYPQPSK